MKQFSYLWFYLGIVGSTFSFVNGKLKKPAPLTSSQATWVIVAAVVLIIFGCVCYLYRRLYPHADEFSFTSLAVDEPRFSKGPSAFEIAMMNKKAAEKMKEKNKLVPKNAVPDSFLSQLKQEEKKEANVPLISKVQGNKWQEWDKHINTENSNKKATTPTNNSTNSTVQRKKQKAIEPVNNNINLYHKNNANKHNNNNISDDSSSDENAEEMRAEATVSPVKKPQQQNNKNKSSDKYKQGVDEKDAELSGAEANPLPSQYKVITATPASPPSADTAAVNAAPAASAAPSGHPIKIHIDTRKVNFPPRNVALPAGPAPKKLLAVKMAEEGIVQSPEQYSIDIQFSNNNAINSALNSSRPSSANVGKIPSATTAKIINKKLEINTTNINNDGNSSSGAPSVTPPTTASAVTLNFNSPVKVPLGASAPTRNPLNLVTSPPRGAPSPAFLQRPNSALNRNINSGKTTDNKNTANSGNNTNNSSSNKSDGASPPTGVGKPSPFSPPRGSPNPNALLNRPNSGLTKASNNSIQPPRGAVPPPTVLNRPNSALSRKNEKEESTKNGADNSNSNSNNNSNNNNNNSKAPSTTSFAVPKQLPRPSGPPPPTSANSPPPSSSPLSPNDNIASAPSLQFSRPSRPPPPRPLHRAPPPPMSKPPPPMPASISPPTSGPEAVTTPTVNHPNNINPPPRRPPPPAPLSPPPSVLLARPGRTAPPAT